MDKQNGYFEFRSFEIDEERRKILFNYRMSRESGEVMEFTETVGFPSPIPASIPNDLLESVLKNLHLMLGISYWKLFCPKDIRINSYSLTKEQVQFWNTVYTKGLGEFFYKNKIDSNGLVSFPYDEKINPVSINFERQDRSLVGLGGGKDSLVSIELLKENNKPATAFILETQRPYSLINGLLSNIGIDSLVIKREIDPKLFEVNKINGAHNGHIPISAIYAFAGLLAAVVYDYRYIIVSNEKSSNIGNIEHNGQTVNHQWSKSEEFENLFNKYVEKFITPDVNYYSYLRAYSEIEIAKMFSKYDKYFKLFSSCNNNFKVNGNGGAKWCGHCAKCAFTFSMMAAFLPKEKVIEIFGRNLFEDESLIPMYKDLLGVGTMKPFDCVGTFEETIDAFKIIQEKKEFANDAVMKMFETIKF